MATKKYKHGVLLTRKELDLLCEGNERAISNRLNKLLDEERSVADKVDKFINSLYSEVSANIKEIVKERRYEMVRTFNGKRLHLSFFPFVCKTPKEEEELLKTNQQASNCYSLYMDDGQFFRDIVAPVIVVSGKIDIRKFFDDLQHEIEHIFQQDCIGVAYKNPYLSAHVNSNIYSPEEYKRVPARILYYGNPIEQDAFVNGLYGYVMTSLKNGLLPVEKNKIEAFIAYRELCNAYKYLLDNRNNEDFLREIQRNYHTENFHYTYHRLKERGREAISEFEKKISRVLQKCQDDAAKLGIRVTDTDRWLI